MDLTSSPGHRSAVMAAMVAAGALIAQQVAGKATRDALFLSTFQVSSLPVVMIAAALVSALAVLGFSTALSRRGPARVVPATLAAATVLLLAEWGLSLVRPRVAAVAVYLHMAAFGATVVSAFWSLVSERFDPHVAKGVMGNISLGASLGGVGGGLLAWTAAGALPVTALLAVMASFNVICLLALARFRASPAPASTPAASPARRDDVATGPLSGLRLMREVPYLRDLGLLVALGAATETLLDYVLGAHAAATFPRGQPLLSFFALFHTGVGVAALALQMALLRPALRGLGLAGTVALRPAAVAAGALAGLVEPRLWSALLARGAHGVLHNALFRPAYELLFTPLPERRKRPTKTIVDVGFDKLGTVAGGLLALAVTSAFAAESGRASFAIAVGGGLGALLVARRLHRGYITALEDSLRSGVVRLELADVLDSTTLMTYAASGIASEGEALRRELAALRGRRAGEEAPPPPEDAVTRTVAELRSGRPDHVRRALQRPEAADPALVGHLVPLLARDDVFVEVVRVLRRAAARATGQLLDALLDPRQDVAVRRRIPRVLRGTATPRAAEGLLLGVSDPSFGVRRQCALTLARITERNPGIVVPRAAVFDAALRELVAAPQGWAEEAEPEGTEDGPSAPRAQTPSGRGLAHVFTLLSLAVEREPLQIAYWAVLGPDAALRGTALEYLENVLPEDVRRALWPHLGAHVRHAPSTRPRQEVVRELMKSSDTLGLSREMMRRIVPPR